LARAITLVESRRSDHRATARALVQMMAPDSGAAMRVGITGVPGVGKSTLIDALGSNLTAAGHRIAVLAVDPSSKSSGGSILGDKTRMARLAVDPNAFIRPSPSAGTLGGVAARTREAMILCEAAGFDILLIETVGVGQSETAVADMTDFFLVLALPGAGDELQGIKKGIIEQADMVAVNKADVDPARARQTAAEYGSALRILAPASPNWTPPVMLASGLANQGLAEMWSEIERHRAPPSAPAANLCTGARASRSNGCGPCSRSVCWAASSTMLRSRQGLARSSAKWVRARWRPRRAPNRSLPMPTRPEPQPFFRTLSAFLSILPSSALDIRPAFTAWLARALALRACALSSIG
jgi:LAO/AO transport system kinase